ncbi:MAG: hypothetical protein ACRDHV_03115 [Actinomycetota bacterium]
MAIGEQGCWQGPVGATLGAEVVRRTRRAARPRRARRVAGFLVSVTALSLMLAEVPAPASTSGPITLNLIRPNQTALANSLVAVYMEPFEPPEEYVPNLLASGRTDAAGRFSFEVPDSIQSSVAEHHINALVRAMDPQRRWLVDWTLVLPTSGPATETVPAMIRVSDAFPQVAPSDEEWVGAPTVREEEDTDPDDGDPSESEVVVEEPDSDACTQVTADAACALDHAVASKRRWVKVTQHHLSKGMKGTFSYLKGRETQTEIAAKVGGGDWYVGGWVTELKKRSDSHEATKEGPFHRVWLARYRYVKYHYVFCNEWTAICYDAYHWKPKHWTGGIARSDWVASQPDRDPQYSEKLVGTYTRDSGQNVTFGMGVHIAGLSLSSQAGYSAITQLTWKKIAGCPKARWLFGAAADPAVAKIIFARCE